MITSAEHAALRDLSARYGLSPAQTARLERLVSALASDARAPTTLRDPARSIDGHIADSLVALEVEAVREAHALADLGAGAGFPGLPLAVALARSDIWLLESHGRKCAYLRAVVTAAGLAGVSVVCERIEDWDAGRGALDVALARALAPQAVVLEYAAPLLRRGGFLIDWRGRRDRGEELRSELAARELGMERAEVRRVTPFAGARDRHLHLYMKVSDTPARFPRRAGMAVKRPLGRRP